METLLTDLTLHVERIIIERGGLSEGVARLKQLSQSIEFNTLRNLEDYKTVLEGIDEGLMILITDIRAGLYFTLGGDWERMITLFSGATRPPEPSPKLTPNYETFKNYNRNDSDISGELIRANDWIFVVWLMGWVPVPES